MSTLAVVFAIAAGLHAAENARLVQERVSIPMRDGVKLSANVFRQHSVGRSPVILVRTPYGKGKSLPASYRRLAESGYAVVVQDVRGRYDSEGLFDPLRQEVNDGDDTLHWLSRQQWCNGRIGMTGGSYVGIVQWKAALSQNPFLKAIFPVVSGYDDYRDRFYSTGGALKLGNRLLWMSANLRSRHYRPPSFEFFVRALPLTEADLAATGQSVPMFQEALEHPAFDSYWKSISTREKLDKVKVPVYIVGGWYDNFVQSDLEAFATLFRKGRSVHALVGPWPHNMSIPFDGDPFGHEKSAPIQRLQAEWFDWWLKERPPVIRNAPLRIFVMGLNKWRDEQEWPLARAVTTPFFLSGSKGANSLAGDGALEIRPQPREHTDRYTYDPTNPVPTRGGSVCCNPRIFPWGPMDQRAIETRRDVLVYSSQPLKRNLEVTGPIQAVLYVATSARDTDFTVKLVDVHPDGRAINLTDGILRLRYREGLERAVLSQPGKVYAIRVDAGVTSNLFKAGHRIRVEVSSSNFPRFDRNLNTGGPIGRERRGQPAEQFVFMGKKYPSAILLPVVRD